MLLSGLGSVRIGKNCDRGLENAALGLHFQDLGHSFSLYGPPSRPITYVYLHSYHELLSLHVNGLLQVYSIYTHEQSTNYEVIMRVLQGSEAIKKGNKCGFGDSSDPL